MTGYVIVRHTDGEYASGQYVARPAQAGSYTSALRHAHVYPSREAAAADCCTGNESVVALATLFQE